MKNEKITPVLNEVIVSKLESITYDIKYYINTNTGIAQSYRRKTNGAFAIHNVSNRLFDVTYQGQDDEGLIVRTITIQAENASEAAEKVRQCGLQLRIYSSNAC